MPFGDLLRTYRERAGLSQRSLAARSGVNVAIINRMESGDRGASGPDQVLAIAGALGLGEDDTDSLLASAGFWPRALLRLGPGDPTLLTVARVLGAPYLDEASKDRFRRVAELLADQWLAGAGGAVSSGRDVRPGAGSAPPR